MELKNPDAPASKAQTFKIFTLTKKDVRDQNLTMAQASAMIEELLAAKNGQEKIVSAPRNFSSIIKEATKAANEAGDQWMAEHSRPAYEVLDKRGRVIGQMLDVCGFAWIIIKDRRTSFAKWAEKTGIASHDFLHIAHKYKMRQELGLAEACGKAALQVLVNHEIKGLYFESRID
jgi:hypothetical protein